jgi:hypothetical protein
MRGSSSSLTAISKEARGVGPPSDDMSAARFPAQIETPGSR